MSLLNIKDLILKKENALILLVKKRNPNLNVLLKRKLNVLTPLVRTKVQQLNQLDLLLVLKIFI